MNNFDCWYSSNKSVLDNLYHRLITLSKSYGIIIKDNNNSYDNYLYMMYNESTKKIINKNLYPEYYIKYNSIGYDEYKILNIH
jgi:hypothetical protein